MQYNGQIYKITNLVNGKIYVGRTKYKLKERFRQHASDKRTKSAIHAAIVKYGKENFTIEGIEAVSTIEQAMEREKYWIKELDAQNKEIGYNLTEGGDDKRIVAKALVKNRDYYIKCNETGETFESHVDASDAFGVSKGRTSYSVLYGVIVRGTYTFSKVSKEGNQLTGPLDIKRETRFAGLRRIKCVETGEIFDSVDELAKNMGFSYTGVRKIIKNTTKHDGLSYVFIDKAANRDTRNGTTKVSKPIKRLEDGRIFPSLNAMARELGFSGNYASYVLKRMGGIHKGLHYIFLPSPSQAEAIFATEATLA